MVALQEVKKKKSLEKKLNGNFTSMLHTVLLIQRAEPNKTAVVQPLTFNHKKVSKQNEQVMLGTV